MATRSWSCFPFDASPHADGAFPDSLGVLLPEVQRLREFGALLTVKVRLEIAEGRLDDALWDSMWKIHGMAHVWAARAVVPEMVSPALSTT